MPVCALERELQQVLGFLPVLTGEEQRGTQQAAGTSLHEVLEGDRRLPAAHTQLTPAGLERLSPAKHHY
jgi:hypothetical protein